MSETNYAIDVDCKGKHWIGKLYMVDEKDEETGLVYKSQGLRDCLRCGRRLAFNSAAGWESLEDAQKRIGSKT